jgi:hypothetical protein
MVRAVRILGPPLATKLSWVGTAGSPDYVATATAYRAACGPPMLEALRAARSFEDLLERLGAAGLTR